jgi:hypothetical protein
MLNANDQVMRYPGYEMALSLKIISSQYSAALTVHHVAEVHVTVIDCERRESFVLINLCDTYVNALVVVLLLLAVSSMQLHGQCCLGCGAKCIRQLTCNGERLEGKERKE